MDKEGRMVWKYIYLFARRKGRNQGSDSCASTVDLCGIGSGLAFCSLISGGRRLLGSEERRGSSAAFN